MREKQHSWVLHSTLKKRKEGREGEREGEMEISLFRQNCDPKLH